MSGSGRSLLPEFAARHFHDRPLLRRLFGNSVWQIGDKVFRMGAGVFVAVYVARYLGPPGLGLLSFGTALATLVSAIAQFGANSVVVRDLVAMPKDRPAILASGWLLRTIGAVGSSLLSVVLSFLLRPGDARSAEVVFLVACAAFPQAWDVIDYDYQSRLNAPPVVIARNASFVVLALTRVLLVIVGAPVQWFALAFSGEAALSAILLVRRWRRDGLSVSMLSARWSDVRQLAAMSWPLVIAGLSLSIYLRVDQVMLGKMLGDREVGLFAAAVRISEALYFLPQAVAASVAPALTAARSRGVLEYEHRLLKVTRMLVWIGIAVAVTFTIFSRPIVLALYGPRFAPSAAVLSIHTWAGVLVSLGICSNMWLINEGYLKYSMYQTVVGALVNVALNLFLIPRLGIIGAALASCAAQLASVMATVAVLPKARRLVRLQLAAFLPPLPAAGA